MGQVNGVFPAVVIDNVDPKNLGRVKVQLPQMDVSGQRSSKVWARMATLMAGQNRGTWFIPDVNDEVLVAFEVGDVRRPYVIGSLWNDSSSPPETMNANNNKKLLRSRNGVTITLDDQNGQERFVVETPGGQKVTLKEPFVISLGPIHNVQNVVVILRTADGCAGYGECSPYMTINGESVDTCGIVGQYFAQILKGMVTVNSGMSKFSGVVQCDTLISNSVISASYTPGAGNIF